MKKSLLSACAIFCSMILLNGQILFEENFEGGSIPEGWTIVSMATDGGWKIGSPAALSSQYFSIPPNGSSNIAATNDDNCNCNKRDEYFITPAIDLSGQTGAVLTFDSYFLANSYLNDMEDASIEISLDGTSWTVLDDDLHGHNFWDTHTINLSEYVGNSTVYIGFRYNDNGGFLYGFGIDNVKVSVPVALEVDLVHLTETKYGEVGRAQKISGTIFNGGSVPITSIDFSYTINGENPVSESLTGLNIDGFTFYNFESATPWSPNEAGIYDIEVRIDKINGVTDETPDNNVASFSSEIFPFVVVPNKMADFLASSTPEILEVSGASPLMDSPTDLDFFPINGKDALWIINQRTESVGGSTVTISDATKGPTNFEHKVDGNAWHFMSLPTAIAFSDDNFNFANSPGVQDANHNGGTFTGPALWSSDPLIYAQPSGGNGSHLDMLHGSPFSMGIAHEKDNVFWIYDDWNKDIVRYDFVGDHGPGNDDHSDGILRRFKNIGIDGDGDIPNHMILDKDSGWLYFVDNGNDRVLRLDINSGTGSTPLALINEELAEHSSITGFAFETIIDQGLLRPCGIEIFEHYLLVGDYANGQIRIYDMSNSFELMGTLETGSEGLTGIKVGPDGNIWYTNRMTNGVFMASPGSLVGTKNQLEQIQFQLTPNPTRGIISFQFPDNFPFAEGRMELTNSIGQIMSSWDNVSPGLTLDLSDYADGIYFIQVKGDRFYGLEKVVLNK